MDFQEISVWVRVAVAVTSCLVIGFMIFLFALPTQYEAYKPKFLEKDSKKKNAKNAKTSVQIVVLGDIGRSPRMQYHAISLAKHGATVEIVGYTDSELHPSLQDDKNVSIISLTPAPNFLRTNNKWLFLLTGPIKVAWQTLNLLQISGYRAQPSKWMLIQNPPSIPTIAVSLVLCWWRNTRLVIDWHNLGYSILAQKLGAFHILVWFSSWFETYAGSGAHSHLAVSDAMTELLRELTAMKVSTLVQRPPMILAKTLHDRPAEVFKPLTKPERSSVLKRLPDTAQYAAEIEKKSWALIVSSTSWTSEEDFGLLLSSLVGYSTQVASNSKLPKILAVITGKGPMKEYYLERIRTLNQAKRLSHVIIVTTWLSTKDYAALLGAADLGVSLHKSTSGVDLPMKVVDMFGAGLPVVGWSDFEAWPELVTEGVNGKGFETAQELLDLLLDLLGGDGKELAKLKKGAVEEGKKRWDDEWDEVAGKLFRVVP